MLAHLKSKKHFYIIAIKPYKFVVSTMCRSLFLFFFKLILNLAFYLILFVCVLLCHLVCLPLFSFVSVCLFVVCFCLSPCSFVLFVCSFVFFCSFALFFLFLCFFCSFVLMTLSGGADCGYCRLDGLQIQFVQFVANSGFTQT